MWGCDKGEGVVCEDVMWEVTSDAISSSPVTCRFFSSLISALISGSTSSRGVLPVQAVVVMAMCLRGTAAILSEGVETGEWGGGGG